MSAWIVSKAHIDALVYAGLAGAEDSEDWCPYGPLTWRKPDGTEWGSITHANADEVGQMLMAECVASVTARYPEDLVEEGELPGPNDAYYLRPYSFRLATAPRLTTAVLVKNLGCYEYQSCEHAAWEASCEHAAWEASEAQAYVRVLERTLMREIPGYDAAPWGIDEEHRPKPPTFGGFGRHVVGTRGRR